MSGGSSLEPRKLTEGLWVNPVAFGIRVTVSNGMNISMRKCIHQRKGQNAPRSPRFWRWWWEEAGAPCRSSRMGWCYGGSWETTRRAERNDKGSFGLTLPLSYSKWSTTTFQGGVGVPWSAFPLHLLLDFSRLFQPHGWQWRQTRGSHCSFWTITPLEVHRAIGS
jgi:hypothetical protein